MDGRQIELADLVGMDDGTVIDMAEITDVVDPAYRLVTEEVEDFIERPASTVKAVKNSFSSFLPATALRESIEQVLKVRNVQEERLKKHMQFEFDRKMQRINRIKSRAYRRLQRRDKLRKEQALQVDSDESSSGTEEREKERGSTPGDAGGDSPKQGPILEFEGGGEGAGEELVDPQFGIVREAFRDPVVEGNEKEFLEAKLSAVEKDAPKTVETVLPGWDDWAGEGLEIKKTKYNTVVEKTDGIAPSRRRDYNKSNVIINEHVEVSGKYKASLPYGYRPAEYREQLKAPISPETNSLRVFRRFIKITNKDQPVSGQNIKPNEFEPEY